MATQAIHCVLNLVTLRLELIKAPNIQHERTFTIKAGANITHYRQRLGFGVVFFDRPIPIRSLKQWMESALGRKSHFGPECPGGTVPQMWVLRSESEVGVCSLSKALTTMRLVSVGSINPSSPSWPTVSWGKHGGGRFKVGLSRLGRLNLIMD